MTAPGLPTLVEADLEVHPVEDSHGLVGPAGIAREAVPPNSPEVYLGQTCADLEVFGRVVERAGIRPEN